MARNCLRPAPGLPAPLIKDRPLPSSLEQTYTCHGLDSGGLDPAWPDLALAALPFASTSLRKRPMPVCSLRLPLHVRRVR